MSVAVICRVHHVMYIPAYPSKKSLIVICNSCNKAYLPAAFPALHTQAEHLLAHTKYKWYHYTGMVLFIIFFSTVAILLWIGSQETDRRNKTSLAELTTGDIIFFKTEDKKNTSMKVEHVHQDTVWVYENILATNKSARDIDEDENYDNKKTYFLRKQLENMLYQNIITDIDH